MSEASADQLNIDAAGNDYVALDADTVVSGCLLENMLPSIVHQLIAKAVVKYGKFDHISLRSCNRYWRSVCNLDITSSCIGADHLETMVPFLLELPRIQELTITGHSASASPIKSHALANLTAKLGTLRLTSAVGVVKIGEAKLVLENLTSLLLPFSASLTRLSLRNCNLPGSSGGNLVWSPGFFSRLPCLSVLHMAAIHVGTLASVPKGTFDLDGCTGLQKLTCRNCNLQCLDVSACSKIELLDCSRNHIRGCLRISACTNLQTLHCQRNQLTALQLPHGDALKDLCCFMNQLESLNLSHCTSLASLKCNNNRLAAVIIPDRVHLHDLDLGLNPSNLVVSGCFSSTILNLKCHMDEFQMLRSPEMLRSFKTLCVYGADIAELSGFRDLLELDCDMGHLDSVNLTGCGAAAVRLRCTSSCDSLCIHGRSSVWMLSVSGVSGPSDLVGFTGLRHLTYCLSFLHGNVLDLSVCCKALQKVRVIDSDGNGFSSLTAIILTGCDQLEELSCEGFSTLQELDLTACTSLKTLTCVGSSIRSLDMSCCLLLHTVNVSKSNLLESILLPCKSSSKLEIKS